ncbi:MAG: Gfo/Idh/MocA family oxidoreductase [Spirochaetaceae bacterium]|nr:MAG: Gfo/Idh/MocA family oxidoreductase [Spirochaetaceae bacterium]
MDAVRWGVLGVANIFMKKVLPPLLKSDLVSLEAIASRSGDRARRAAETCGIEKSYGSYEELLADQDIESVYIPLPNHLHAEWIRKAADAGKHILCEKPLALNAEEAAACLEYTARAGVRLMEAFMYRFHPQWRRVEELVRMGEIGEVLAVQTYYAYDLKDPENIRNKVEMGGGGLMDIGCYAVSVPRFIFGREPERVIGMFTRDSDFKTDILTSAILDFGSGRSVFSVATQGFRSQTVDIFGSSGNIHLGIPFNMFADIPPLLTVITAIGERRPQLAAADQYGLEFEAFSKALRLDLPVPTPPEDAVANQKVLDALFRSESSGRWEIP